MKSISRTIAALAAVCASAACASQPTPAAKAAGVAQSTCPTTSAQAWADMHAINQTRAVEVQPMFAFTGGSRSGGSRPEGVKVIVQPQPLTSMTDLTRAIQCRNAQAQLGQTADASPEEAPFYLQDRTVNVSVVRENYGLYGIVASATNIDDNIALMRRTKQYATAHGVAIARDMP